MVFATIAPVLAKIPAILAAIAPATLPARVADVFACVVPILAQIAAVFTTIEAILDPVASWMAKRLGQRRRRGQKRNE
jgi:hypothetical protein